jgi:hypothetical protein
MNMHGNALKTWMTTYLFKQWLVFLYKYVLRGVYQHIRHLLILDGHGSHATIQALKQISKVGLNMVTIHVHTSHVLQPLDVTCFKTFKTTFRKKKILPWQKTIILNQTKLHGWKMRCNNP